MIRIVFDNGEIADCEHVEKMYIEEETFNTLEFLVVDKIGEENVRSSNSGIKESDKNIGSKTSVD